MTTNPPTQPTAYDRITHARDTGRIYGDDEAATIIEAQTITDAPDFVYEGVGIEPGDALIRRKRITKRTDTDQIVSASISWFCDNFLAKTSPALLVAERLPEGTIAYIEATSGWRVTSGFDRVSVGRAEEFEADLLGIAIGDPIRRVRTTLFADDATPIEFSQSISAEGRWSTYAYTID